MMLRAAAGLALAIMLVLLGWRLSLFLEIAAHALRFPFQLDYGEGTCWQQALLLFTREAYGRIDGFPAIVFEYTPIYLALTRAAAGLTGADMLLAGRAVSIGTTLLLALVIGLIVARAAPAATPRAARALAGVGGGLLIFCLSPVVYWAQLLRVDMLAFLFSLLGFWLGLKAIERPGWIHAAALCFVAAVYTKQTAIAAPVATFGLVLWLRPRLALAGIATCLAVGLVVLGALTWLTDGGFVRHVFLYNVNRLEWERLQYVAAVVIYHAIFCGLALVVATHRATEMLTALRGLPAADRRAVVAADRSTTARLGILAYVLATTPMLLSIVKAGSNANYLIEWFLAIVLLVGTGLIDAARAVTGVGQTRLAGAWRAWGAIGVPLLVAVQAWVFVVKESDFDRFWSPQRTAEFEKLSARVRAERKPIISDDMVMLLRSGQRVVWEPAIFAELAKLGVWNETPFVERIRRREFAMFITESRRGSDIFDARYTPAVADAMDAAYPRKEQLAGYTLHLPAAPTAADAGAARGLE